MNVCLLSGRLLKNAVVRGTEPKALTFTLETKYGFNESEGSDRITYVPCVLFNPAREIEVLLTTQGQALFVELEGRINGSHPEANGGRKFNSEVIVRNKTLTILESEAVKA